MRYLPFFTFWASIVAVSLALAGEWQLGFVAALTAIVTPVWYCVKRGK